MQYIYIYIYICYDQDLSHCFNFSLSLCFHLWLSDLAFLDVKFGFYGKNNHPRGDENVQSNNTGVLWGWTCGYMRYRSILQPIKKLAARWFTRRESVSGYPLILDHPCDQVPNRTVSGFSYTALYVL